MLKSTWTFITLNMTLMDLLMLEMNEMNDLMIFFNKKNSQRGATWYWKWGIKRNPLILPSCLNLQRLNFHPNGCLDKLLSCLKRSWTFLVHHTGSWLHHMTEHTRIEAILSFRSVSILVMVTSTTLLGKQGSSCNAEKARYASTKKWQNLCWWITRSTNDSWINLLLSCHSTLSSL